MFKPSIYILLFLLFFTISARASGEKFSRPGWIIIRETCPLTHLSPEEAQRRAMESARRSAVEKVTGVDIQALSFTEDYRLTGDMTQSITRGIVTKDTLLDIGIEYYRKGDNLICELWVEMACSVAVLPEQKSTLQLRASLDKTTYRSGETLNLQVRANEDCYLTILGIWADGAMAVLFPNEYMKSVFLKAGETFKLPDPQDKILTNMKLAVSVLPGERETNEYIKIVAVKKDHPFLGGLGEAELTRMEISPGVYAYIIQEREEAQREFFRWYFSIPPEDVVIEQLMYRVVKE